MRNKFRYLFIVLAVIFSFVPSFAQFRWGATVGGNITDLRFKQDILTVNKSVGYSAGIMGELMFPGIGFGMDFGLNYDQRGATLNMGDWPMWQWEGYGKERCYMHYAVIPIHLRFKYTNLGGLEDIVAPLAYVGPSIGMLVGHSKNQAMSFPFGEFGLDFGLGAELKKNWQITASYTMGMTYSVKANILSNYSARNSGWNLKVTYLF